MQYHKKVSVGAFAKKGIDINNGDLVTISNEGKQVTGQYGPQDVFLVKLANGEEKNISVNKTSINGLIDAFGDDSINWIGKQVKVWIIKSNVAGKFVDVLYIASPRAELTDTGFVLKKLERPAGLKPKKVVAPVVVEEEEYEESEGEITEEDFENI